MVKNAEGVTRWGSYTGRLDDSTSAYRLVAVDRAGHTAAAGVGDSSCVDQRPVVDDLAGIIDGAIRQV